MQVEPAYQATPTGRAALRRPGAGLFLQIVAHGKGAVPAAGKDGDPQPGITRKIIPDFGELSGCGNIHRVKGVWSIDGDDRQMLGGTFVVDDELIAHVLNSRGVAA